MPTELPAHIPAQRVRNYDYFDMDGDTDLHAHFRKLHDGPDFFFTPQHGGHWVATRHDDIAYILENDVDFSSRHATVPFPPYQITLMENDGQLHDDFRKLLQPYFSPKSIVSLEKIAADLTVSLIDGFYERGECEFTQDFAMRMPIIIVMNLCEFPNEDTAYLTQIAEDITRSHDAAAQAAAFGRITNYLVDKIVPARTANPGKDMISAIIHGKVDGGRSPTPMEILGLSTLLIVGGLDTVASMLGFITAFLARHPAHRQQLIDEPARIPKAMEELFRRHGVANVGRTVARDLDYKGIHFKEGDFILTPTAVAGLDDHHYADAMRVDFERVDRKHLAFGRGPHQCIGSYLARTEIRVFLTEWLKRIPHFEIKAGETPRMLPGKANRITYLPLTWKPA